MNNISKKFKVAAVIPFYNEEQFIEKIILETLPFVDIVIAVDDGSTDNSVLSIPKNKKIVVVSYPKNKGKGFALKKGFEASIKLKTDITITLDADFQHQPNYIPNLISELKTYDIVIGNRLSSLNKMPLHRIMSNRLTSFLLSLKTKQRILDSQCGFRAFKTKILDMIMPSFDGFEAESEIIVLAARNNFNIGFCYIPTIYGEEKSKMRSMQTIKGFLKVITK